MATSKTTNTNRKTRRASASKKRASRKRAAASSNGGSELPELSKEQKQRIGAIFEKLKAMRCQHSEHVMAHREVEQAMEKQIQYHRREMFAAAAAMIESVGLDPKDPHVEYHLDPETGLITSKPRSSRLTNAERAEMAAQAKA